MVSLTKTHNVILEEFLRGSLPHSIRSMVSVEQTSEGILLLSDPRKDARVKRNKRSFFTIIREGISPEEREALLTGYGRVVDAKPFSRFPTKMVIDEIGGYKVWVDPHIQTDRAREIASGYFSVGVRGNQLIEISLS